jgi:SAM-dependent methyltransferase
MPVAAPDRGMSDSGPWVPHPGESTAHAYNVPYRISKFADQVRGSWLDFGCADGGYAAELLRVGADQVTGVDVQPDQIAAAAVRGLERASFHVVSGATLPFGDSEFDGALLNEVMEHVADEAAALSEVKRVLRPGATLVVISPNRWFPFEGHGAKVKGWTWPRPAPLVPWVPKRFTARMVNARNYWPRELTDVVRRAGFAVTEVGFVWPVFERYRWLPSRWSTWYRRHIRSFDSVPGIRRFGVSTFVAAEKPLHKNMSDPGSASACGRSTDEGHASFKGTRDLRSLMHDGVAARRYLPGPIVRITRPGRRQTMRQPDEHLKDPSKDLRSV